MHGPRTDTHARARTMACACHGQHGHWPVRATDSTDIGLCVPRTHGRAMDMPRTFPVARYEARSHWHFPPSLVYSSSVDICLSTYEYSSLSRNSSPAAIQGERRRVEYTRGSDRSQMVPVRAWTVVMERSTWDRITVLFERVARVTDDLFRTCRYSYSSPVLVPAARFIEKPTPGFILRNKVLRLVSYFSSEAGMQLQLRNRSPLRIQQFMT